MNVTITQYGPNAICIENVTGKVILDAEGFEDVRQFRTDDEIHKMAEEYGKGGNNADN